MVGHPGGLLAGWLMVVVWNWLCDFNTTFVEHVGLLHVMTCMCWVDVGGGMVDDMQPARVDVLCVLEIDVVGCV